MNALCSILLLALAHVSAIEMATELPPEVASSLSRRAKLLSEHGFRLTAKESWAFDNDIRPQVLLNALENECEESVSWERPDRWHYICQRRFAEALGNQRRHTVEHLFHQNELTSASADADGVTGWPLRNYDILLKKIDRGSRQKGGYLFKSRSFVFADIGFIPHAGELECEIQSLIISRLRNNWRIRNVQPCREGYSLSIETCTTPDEFHFSRIDFVLNEEWGYAASRVQCFDLDGRQRVDAKVSRCKDVFHNKTWVPEQIEGTWTFVYPPVPGLENGFQKECTFSIHVEMSAPRIPKPFDVIAQYDAPGSHVCIMSDEAAVRSHEVVPGQNFVDMAIARDRRVVQKSQQSIIKMRAALAPVSIILASAALIIIATRRRVFRKTACLIVAGAVVLQSKAHCDDRAEDILNRIGTAHRRIQLVDIRYRLIETYASDAYPNYDYEMYRETMFLPFSYAQQRSVKFYSFDLEDDPKATKWYINDQSACRFESLSNVVYEYDLRKKPYPYMLFGNQSYLGSVGFWNNTMVRAPRYLGVEPVCFTDIVATACSKEYLLVDEPADILERDAPRLLLERPGFDTIIVDREIPTRVIQRKLRAQKYGDVFVEYDFSKHVQLEGVYFPMKIEIRTYDVEKADVPLVSKIAIELLDIAVNENRRTGLALYPQLPGLLRVEEVDDYTLKYSQVVPGGESLLCELATWAQRSGLSASQRLSRQDVIEIVTVVALPLLLFVSVRAYLSVCHARV